LLVLYAGERLMAAGAVLLVLAAAVGPSRVQGLWEVSPSIPTTPVAILAVLGAGVYALRRIRALPSPLPAVPVLRTVAVAMAAVALTDPSSLHTAVSDLWNGFPVPPTSTVPAPVIRFVDNYGGMPVVLADQLRSYRLGAYTNAYAVAVPEVRTRAEPASRPDQRRRDVTAFLTASTPQATRDRILRRYGVDIVIVPRKRSALLPVLARDPLLRDRETVPSSGGGLEIYTVVR
jgi:hypothetical protein